MYLPKFDKDGGCKLSHRYKEILRLLDMLNEAKIPCTIRRNFDGWQILYPKTPYFPLSRDGVVCSVIEHFGSYGGNIDELEIMGLLTEEEAQYDTVVGCLSAEEVFERIKYHWENKEAVT